MAKRLVHELRYDAPMADVASMLEDPEFREEVCARQGVLRALVTIDPTDSGMEVTIDQVQAAKGIPSFAKKFVGDEINIVQQESWSSADEGGLTLTIPGKPGEISGTVRLTEVGGVTTETVDLTLKVNVPLVGGRIEGLIADLLVKALKAENRVGRDYLSR